jgi:hypothetical protein
MTTTTTTTDSIDTTTIHAHHLDFEHTLEGIGHRARSFVDAKFAFTTDAEGLWPAFLAALPADQRQHHTCTACRHFVERFGSLVVVQHDGTIAPLLWGVGFGIYGGPIAKLASIVQRARINGVHVSTERTWGNPILGASAAGPWQHLALEHVPAQLVATASPIETCGQRAAKIRHERGLLAAALVEYPPQLVAYALGLLESGKLYRSEACVGVARWLVGLHESWAGIKGPRSRDNLTWLAAASAPAGWCHVGSGMIGTLLDDLKAGMNVEVAARRFAEKMNPLQYQRPTAPVSAGNVAQAEKLVDALGLRRSLERRFARLEDLTTVWTPAKAEAPATAAAGSTFGHLLEADRGKVRDLGTSPIVMTWAKFAATVLPTAELLDVYAPPRGNYTALITAAHADAPPIVQWDRAEQRNPVTWYVYNNGSEAHRWNLRSGWVECTAICLSPPHWHGPGLPKHDHCANLILAGARDTGHATSGGLFPEHVRSELHEVRSTVEAYAMRAPVAGCDEATACGLAFTGRDEVRVRVTSKGIRTEYRLDRWD